MDTMTEVAEEDTGLSTMALVGVVGATTISVEATTTDTVIETITRVRELHPQVGRPQLCSARY